jgi:tRNA-2-methylthio-N6-dimethylallyladenosine synthase
VQSGNTDVLKRMNRGYSREWYLNRVDAIKRIMPDCAISTDIITGFCGETEAEFKDTVSLIEQVKYNFSYMFFYSERPKTLAERKFEDDIPLAVKKSRLQSVIDLQHQLSLKSNKKDIGKTFKVLIEGLSKRSNSDAYGRNSQYVTCIFPKDHYQAGDYVNVKIHDCTTTTLIGKIV